MSNWNKDVLIAENQMLVETQNTALAELRKENEQLKKELETLKAKLETAEYWNKKYDDCQQQLTELKEKYYACQEARKLEINFKSQEFNEHMQELIDMEKQRED